MTFWPHKLADHAYVCLADDRLVIADVHQDRYQCLDRQNTQHAMPLFFEFHSTNIAHNSDTDREQTEFIIRSLTNAGLISDEEGSGKVFASIQVESPTANLQSDGTIVATRPGNCVSFMRAAIMASVRLRLQPLECIARDVEARKRSGKTLPDHDAMHMLTAVFHRLRPFYVREYLCRFDSLALIEFLALYRQFPDWVFGVTGEPFSAHCWVQDGNCVLNDTVDYVKRFTPIMAF